MSYYGSDTLVTTSQVRRIGKNTIKILFQVFF